MGQDQDQVVLILKLLLPDDDDQRERFVGIDDGNPASQSVDTD